MMRHGMVGFCTYMAAYCVFFRALASQMDDGMFTLLVNVSSIFLCLSKVQCIIDVRKCSQEAIHVWMSIPGC